MYQLREHTEVKKLNTELLLVEKAVEKLIITSSIGTYGEGRYINESGKLFQDCGSELIDLPNHNWEMHSENGISYTTFATPENLRPALSYVYALSKYDQENLVLIIAKAYGITTTVLRFFNICSTRQSPPNLYTGISAIFALRLLNNNPPLIFEDGLQKRDFVHVKYVARACRLALETSKSDKEVFNIGSGCHYPSHKIPKNLYKVLGKDVAVEATFCDTEGGVSFTNMGGFFYDFTTEKMSIEYVKLYIKLLVPVTE